MMTPGSANALLLADAGYQIQRSVRTRGAYPATPSYFSRTAGTPTNNLKWTFSGWLKQGVLSVGQHILTAGTGTSASEDYLCFFASQNRLGFVQDNASSTYLTTAQLFRDPSAWYHIVFVYDSAQATASDRAIFYVNGVRVTALNAATYPTLNQASKINSSGLLHRISSRTYTVTEGFDGYLTDINFIDGQALTPASFGEINSVTGVWSAKKYAGTYGTNGFFLNFSDNSAATAAAIGKDSSGNGNNWTPTNISVTAGVTYDSMLDVPLGAGGGERGNYAVLNPLSTLAAGAIVSGANLNIVGASASGYGSPATMLLTLGKWYFEVTAGSVASRYPVIGVQTELTAFLSSGFPGGYTANGFGYGSDGNKFVNNGAATAFGSTFTSGDVIGVAIDIDSGKVWLAKNNTWQASGDPAAGTNSAYSPTAGTPLYPCVGTYNGAGTHSVNFGQRPFAYTPPTGFKALHTGNLPEPVIKLPAQYMAATLYSGTGAAQNIYNTVNGVSFQPDLVWMKSRNITENHQLFDSVRGVQKSLYSNLTNAEITDPGVYTFNTDGFNSYNANGYTYVAWQWKANGAAVTNTAGSITSQVSAGVSQGFSVVTYTGNDTTGATVGHGLGVAPKIIIVKERSTVRDWTVYHISTGNTGGMRLNGTGANETTRTGWWNNTTPSSTVITLGGSTGNDWYQTNQTGNTYVAYCFSEVAGFSKFGSYTGNGSADGPFVFCGFRPRFVMFKRTDSAGSWFMEDTSRGTFNVMGPELYANSSDAEGPVSRLDVLSNGFKMRAANAGDNASGGTYIFMAFAENPFKNSLAR
jgi:hypothetical protein